MSPGVMVFSQPIIGWGRDLYAAEPRETKRHRLGRHELIAQRRDSTPPKKRRHRLPPRRSLGGFFWSRTFRSRGACATMGATGPCAAFERMSVLGLVAVVSGLAETAVADKEGRRD